MKAIHRLIFFSIVAVAQPLVAGISAPRSSVVFSSDGSKVMVMVSPCPGGDTRPTVPFPDGRIVDLHATFPKSGVYSVKDFKPVWQADWFSLDWDYLCSDDLNYVVRRDRFADRTGSAIAFYDRGNLVKTYDCRFLLRSFRSRRYLPYSTWDWHFEWYDHLELSSDHQSVEISTARRHLWLGVYDLDLGVQEFYTFDLKTGVVERQHSTLARVLVVDALMLIATAAGIVFAIRTLWRKVKRLGKRLGFPVIVSMPS